jgi:elongation factor G
VAIFPRERIRNFGISAHIDSGKTTLTERILYYTGRIHAIHEVKGKDGVGATMDFMEQERERGITIQSAATYCMWKGADGTWDDQNFNIIDTPGHVDFTIEVERSLRVLDGAILVLCGVAGVQSQSLTVDRQMRRYKVPRIAFVNKCDRAGADPLRVCQMLRDILQHNAVLIQHPIGLENQHKGVVDLITREAWYFEGEKGDDITKKPIPDDLKDVCEKQRTKLVEALADLDDGIAEKFLGGEDVTPAQIYPVLRRVCIARQLTPVCLGSAYKNKGVQMLLDNIVRYLPSPLDMKEYEALDQRKDEAPVPLECRDDKPLCMLAFKLDDGQYGQLTYCRVYQGSFKKGDFIVNQSNQRKSKVARLVQMHANKMNDLEEAHAGDLVALFGIECSSGDTFTDGSVDWTMTSMYIPAAVVTLAVEPAKKEMANNFSKALNRFSKEDPTFRVYRDEESAQTIIAGMGELHLEIYLERMKREYQVEVISGQPQVAFREAITRRADYEYTHKKQTGGSGQYAKIGGYIEPIPPDEDSGTQKDYEFVSEIVGGVIPKEFIVSCDKGFKESVKKGPLIGFPVVGIRCVVNDGNTHPVDSKDIAFQTAAKFAFRETYPKCNPVILEPIMKVEVDGPEQFAGTILGGLNKRRGVISGNSTNMGAVKVTALVPLKEMFGYSNDLRSGTQGKAEFTMEFAKYQQVPKQVQEALIAEEQAKKKQLAGSAK